MFKKIVEPSFGDLDGLKHVNNNVLGKWFELGRNDIFRFFTPDLNVDHDVWRLIMLRTEFDFLKQIYFDGNVEIRTFIIKIGNSSFKTGHEAWQNGELKAKGKSIVVQFNFLEQKSVPISEDIKSKLKEHYISEEEFDKGV